MHDALVGDEFDVATEDSCAEYGEGSAGFAMDVSRLVGEGRELLGVEKDGLLENQDPAVGNAIVGAALQPSIVPKTIHIMSCPITTMECPREP